jgi:hypothetical protein
MTEDALIRKVPVVLQSCTMSDVVQLGSCNETGVTSPNSAHEVITVEDDSVDTEEQVIPMPISFSPFKTEQDKVSYVSLCPFLDTFTEYSVCQLCVVVSMSLSAQQLQCDVWKFLSVLGYGNLWQGDLQVNICSYLITRIKDKIHSHILLQTLFGPGLLQTAPIFLSVPSLSPPVIYPIQIPPSLFFLFLKIYPHLNVTVAYYKNIVIYSLTGESIKNDMNYVFTCPIVCQNEP